ncbi:AbiJ-NTD4 domain-containing protein [Sphingosinicella sp. LY1275]|uniref:AbiJ-NTD4 domain-containing protein n=1 Tax=Sphingosinicella sp. LY1275 TaxID=3095379 RepID=UPI002ADEE451|nr:hypothetical protein [Sphingosinicella sp. LY1275]MEA1015036.1 hypothetical protein [Sphingosinicella sp. LY1275]
MHANKVFEAHQQMLTDIFSRRYSDVQLRADWYEEDRAFMVQSATMLKKLLWDGPPADKTPATTEASFKYVHDVVALELGHEFLSDRYWFHRYKVSGDDRSTAYTYDYATICKNFLTKPFPTGASADRFIKDRLSLVEQGFRYMSNRVQFANQGLALEVAKAKGEDAKRGERMSGMGFHTLLGAATSEDLVRNRNLALNQKFDAAVYELNERLRIAKYRLHYHNGFIQFADDALTTDQIQKPFWAIVREPKWANVDLLMKEAVDKRDRGDRDAVSPAMQALESAIKIISDAKGWTTGKEKGATNYIDNLVPERDGVRFIAVWEKDVLVKLFGDVRNHFGHGPGNAPLPTLRPQQADWLLDTVMAWIKSLVRRL